MSSVRLTFLYPHLFRALRTCEPSAPTLNARARISRRQRQTCRSFTSAGRKHERFVQRHGKAVEPFLAHGERADGVKVYTPVAKSKDEKPPANASEAENDAEKRAKSEPSSAAPLSEETQAGACIPGDESIPVAEPGKSGDLTPRQQAVANPAESAAPLETVLHMPPPETAEEENAGKPPHLQTPPYVHHFDTYTLVQQVEAGGFTTDQSVTAMKAVRGLLALNLDVAKAGLVSKSDVENETYLFRAACSELRTEIQNTRKKDDEAMRRERTLLQHEVDILNQKLTQELLTLKDDLKGMFDDRKMSVRSEQRTMESKIQELNYKITVLLNSDSKSEIEGLRWVLTRRSVMGILFMAFMVLTSLRYASYKSHEEDVKLKKKEEVARADAHPEGDLPAQGAAEILAAN
ncbi:MOZ protein represents a chromatin-associated acetyltransferase [Diplocarpon rosae]|nr:MOZ protein represents a chromatin-associated acetyltransferase [Diplocarpon rosae]